jgi:hypothetical protein
MKAFLKSFLSTVTVGLFLCTAVTLLQADDPVIPGFCPHNAMNDNCQRPGASCEITGLCGWSFPLNKCLCNH